MDVYVEQFNSIDSFYNYLCDTPFNDVFRWCRHASVNGSHKFTGTYSFDEAVGMMKNGWHTMATNLTQRLEIKTKHDAPVMKQRNVLSVSGYQPVVPLYLAGVPTNMVNKQLVAFKSKVINVTKSVNYNCCVKVDRMVEESIKALQIVKRLESQGYRCNLFVANGVQAGNKRIICKVKVKNANERLNISKLSFPMVHPSMLRRLFFRFIEVYPEVTSSFTGGYGYPISFEETKKAFPNDIVIPAVFNDSIDGIVDLESLVATV